MADSSITDEYHGAESTIRIELLFQLAADNASRTVYTFNPVDMTRYTAMIVPGVIPNFLEAPALVRARERRRIKTMSKPL
ncbi:hypothetical protein N7456_006065 [Penicillium angulare]|uniref:Uncharacterized protein n=1 Tax=Penicillium angulare TaxID=116970 RepID=A0A9W9FZM7_9EURO|nr:hypothetical protein N7456_006065 [Penicillium angulare]